MMSLWDALRMNMMISYQELVRTFLIEMETDDNGMNVINKDELDDVLASSVVKFDDFSSQS